MAMVPNHFIHEYPRLTMVSHNLLASPLLSSLPAMGVTAAAFQVAATSAIRFSLTVAPLLPPVSLLYAKTLIHSHDDDAYFPPSLTPSNIAKQAIKDYVNLIRPITLIQAVGAFVVGCLAIETKPPLRSIVSIYLSYGSGMVANDCVDGTLDAMHSDKKNRAIPAGRITVQDGWIFCSVLAALSCILAAFINTRFLVWTLSNLAIMLLYALGLQKVFLVKNVIVGYLGISPLIGSILVASNANGLSSVAISSLSCLASVGMTVGIAREILKDIEDTQVDKAGGKSTLANIYSPKVAHRIAFGIVWATCLVMVLPAFRNMFVGPCYLTSWCIGTGMILRAAFLPVKQGQSLLKKSIYVLMGGMVAGFLAASH